VSRKPYRPYVAGSSTSQAAAASQVGKAAVDEARVLDLIRTCGNFGATDDEVEQALHLLHQTASARRRGLVLKDLVVDSGRTRLTRTSRHATVWIASTTTQVPPPPVTLATLEEAKAAACRHGEERSSCILCRARR